jgi:hypothetical protein
LEAWKRRNQTQLFSFLVAILTTIVVVILSVIARNTPIQIESTPQLTGNAWPYPPPATLEAKSPLIIENQAGAISELQLHNLHDTLFNSAFSGSNLIGIIKQGNGVNVVVINSPYTVN